MSRSQIGGVIGAAAGAVAGYYSGGQYQYIYYGYAIGSGLGALTDKPKSIQGPRLDDLRFTSSQYGQPIPWIRGSPRVGGQIVWASDKKEISSTSSQGKGGGPSSTSFTYEMDVLVLLCDLEASAVLRIFSNGKLVWTNRDGATSGSLLASEYSDLWRRMTFYSGASTQLPDPTYEADVGFGNAPSYRGRTTLMIEGLQLGNSGQLPNLTFEVARTSEGTGYERRFGIAATGGPMFGRGGSAGVGRPAILAMFPVTRIAVTTVGSTLVYEFDTSTGDYLGTSTRQGTNETYPGEAASSSYPVGILQEKPVRAQNMGVALGTPSTYFVAAGIADGFVSSGYDFTTLLPAGRYFGGVTLSSDRAHVVIFTGPTNAAGGSATLDRWDLIRYDGTIGQVVRTGTLDSAKSIYDFGFGNSTSYHYLCSAMSDDLTTLWTAYGAGNGIVRRYVIGADDVMRLVNTFDQVDSSDGIIDHDFTFPSIWAEKNYCVVVAQDSIMLFGPKAFAPVDEPLQATVEALCARAGMPAGSYDASGLAGAPRQVRSLAVTGGASRAVLEQLALAFFFQACLRDKIYFRPRGAAPAATIPWTDLAAGPDQASEQSLPLTVGNDLELPPQVAVNYVNISDDSQAGTEYSDRMTGGQAAVQSVSLGLGMTPSEAKGIADAVVVDGAAALLSGPITLPITYARLDPSDVVEVVDRDGRSYRLRLTRKRDERGVLGFECVGDDAGAIVSAQITDTSQVPTSGVTKPGDTVFQPLDIPLLRDADEGPGYYVAAKGSTVVWPGGQVLTSINNVDFTLAAEINESGVFGACSTTLGNYSGVGFDEMNVLTVSVGSGELASSTRDAMLADQTVNAFLVGSEVIRFRSAAMVSAGVYMLSGLLRGQRGTEWAMPGHVAGERCVLLRPRGMRRVAQQASETNQLRYLRAATLGSTVLPATTNFANTNVGLKPLSPIDLRVTYQTGGSLQLTWQRRTRAATRFVGSAGVNVPLAESAEAYEVEMLTAGNVLFTTLPSTASTLTLPTAVQTATLPVPVARIALISGTYYGVDVGGNANTSLRRLVAQSPAGTILQRSPYLGAVLVDAVYTASDAYTAAYYLTSTVPQNYDATYVQRFALSDVTSAAATYTASTAGDVVGIAHDGTNLWALEQFGSRLRKLNASTLAVVSTYALTAPKVGGLAYASGKLFFLDGTDIVGWNIGTTAEVWRTALPTGFSYSFGILCAGANVFISTASGVHVYTQSAGALVLSPPVHAYAYTGALQALNLFGADVVCDDGPGPQRFVVLNASTGAVSMRFSGAGGGLLGADSTRIWLAGQTTSTGAGADIARGYEPVGASLSGYKVRVFQLSSTVGRGYVSPTLTIP